MPHAAVLALLLALAAPQGDGAFEARVNGAIDRGAAWLKARQKPNGTWDDPHSGHFESGVAALGFLTLVKSGVGESEPAVQRCLRYFDEYRAFQKTYSTGVLLLAWEALKRGDKDRPRAEAAAKWLMEHRDGPTKLWAYPEGDVDLSNTQYAILGLHAAARMGVVVPREFLFESLQAAVKRQQKESSYTYRDPNDIGTGSMTTAGILALRVAAMQLKGFGPYEAVRADWEAREKAAFDWLERHYRVDMNPAGFTPRGGMRPWHYYYLYGLERICSLAGRKALAGHSWYREGAELLLAQQEAEGTWKGNATDTCFALLFLRRATLTWTPDPKASVDTAAAPAGDAALARPTAPKPEVPYLRSWLVAGPFPNKRGEPFGKDEIGEAQIKGAAEGESAGGSTRRWKRAEIQGPVLAFEKAIAPFDAACVYAFATIRAKKDQDAILWLGHDDGARAWLNGKLVYENETYGEAVNPDAYFARVRLKAGANALLVKVFDQSYDCGLAARVAALDGSPIE